MIMKNYREGASGALLDEYERAIADLQQTISDVSDKELVTIADEITTYPMCTSIQTILSHVVRSGYAYALYIQQLQKSQVNHPAIVLHPSVKNYKKDLTDFFAFTTDSFKNIQDNQLEQSDNSKKIITSWLQVYDIEQMGEHAIVHILRHRRQIEKFKIILRGVK